MKGWSAAVKLNVRRWQLRLSCRIGAVALMAGLVIIGTVSCTLSHSWGSVDGRSIAAANPSTTLPQSTQLHARSGLTAIVDLRSSLSTAATSTGPRTIGYSVAGFPIESYTYGNGPIRVALVGGIHGGVEWNTILLAYAAIDYFDRHPDVIPPAITLQIVPSANPDGQRMVTGSWGRFLPDDVGQVTTEARFNHNGVDLNRNWGCDWAPIAWWGGIETSGGNAPFSEPETRSLRDFFLGDGNPVQAVIFWHSAVPGVFAGGCHDIYPAAERLATIYAQAASYPHGDSFSYYPITGDATNWLSAQGIPAIIVELQTRDDPEWSQNLAGTLAVLDYLAGYDQIAAEERPDQIVTEPQIAR